MADKVLHIIVTDPWDPASIEVRLPDGARLETAVYIEAIDIKIRPNESIVATLRFPATVDIKADATIINEPD